VKTAKVARKELFDSNFFSIINLSVMYENAEDFKIVDVLIMLVITHTNESKAIVALTGKTLDTL
jgi:hypothetical protein